VNNNPGGIKRHNRPWYEPNVKPKVPKTKCAIVSESGAVLARGDNPDALKRMADSVGGQVVRL
jgi:hypothetical protein